MQYFDTHAHYFDDRFYSDECPSGPDALLDGLFAGDICGIVNVATSPANYRAVISQAARYDRMYTALGIHPTDCQSLGAAPAQELPALKALLSDPASKAVALGEIGLDYHYDDTDKPRQLAYFHAQLALAQELDLPVIIHDRDAHGDVFETVCAHPGVRGVLHSYSGCAELAKEYVRRGFLISFSGTITFKGARKTVETAAALSPRDVLIETDAPYLSPVPLRGKLNHSGHLVYTCAALASAMGMTPEECARTTAENAARLFLGRGGHRGC